MRIGDLHGARRQQRALPTVQIRHTREGLALHLRRSLWEILNTDAPDQLGVGLFPLYEGDTGTPRVFWTLTTTKDIFNPAATLFDSKLDTLARVGLTLWALAAYQRRHGIEPCIDGNELTIHIVQPPSPLIVEN